MTEFTRTNTGDTTRFQSAVVAKGATVTLTGLNGAHPHCFIGVELFSDAAGTAVATADAGTFTVSVRTIVNPQALEPLAAPVIDAASLSTTSWAANTSEVAVVPAGITGDAAYYRVNLTQNRG